MVDVVFVLLLFFMASSGSQVVEKELNISLPSGKAAGVGDKTPSPPIIIDIAPDGRITMNNQVYDTATSKELPELRAWLQDTINRFGPDSPVIIRPTLETRHERIMDVLNAAAASGIKNLTFS